MIFTPPFEDVAYEFNEVYEQLTQLTPTVESVDELMHEDEQLEFVKTFRALMRLLNAMKSSVEPRLEDLSMPEQTFEDYKSKYLDAAKR